MSVAYEDIDSSFPTVAISSHLFQQTKEPPPSHADHGVGL